MITGPFIFRGTTMLIAFKLKLALACAAGLAGPIAVAPLVRVPRLQMTV